MPHLLLLRPHNWIKNFFVFVPLFFAHDLFSSEHLLSATYTFLAFCAIASCTYVFNDILDQENDRRHPQKKLRAIAAGKVTTPVAFVLAGALCVTSFAIAYVYVPSILPVISVYIIANIAYSLYLKRVPIVDIVMVSSFYVLRVSAGALAVAVPVSGWLLLATIFVALFLVTAKRRAELQYSDTRVVLQKYTNEFLTMLLLMSVVMMLVVYSIYTVTVLGSHRAIYSIFFVLLGVFRYLYLSMTGSAAEQPEKLIFSDFWIFASAVSWIIFMYLELY